jgi:DNA-binding NtrC family response regulator
MPNILIVDDQPCIRELLSEELILEGYRVHGVSDAEAVREYLLFSPPDLILLDLCLEGGLEGFGILGDIKRQYPHLPVIIVTAYDSFMDDPRLSQADGYLIKSIYLFDDLKRKIAQVLTQQRTDQATAEAEPRSPELATAHGF